MEKSMIARIIFYSTDPDKIENGKKIWDNEMAPALKKQKGFCKAYRADAPDEPGGGVVIQIWESKKDEDAWRSSPAYEEIASRLGPLIPELRIERDFEVRKEV
jgi:heme-degrading monooxygenase HmoA